MNIATLYQQMSAAAAAGSMDASTVAGMGDVLASLGVSGALPVTGGTAGFDAVSAWLRGGTTFRDTGWSFVLTGRDAGDPQHPDWNQLTLQLVPAGSGTWTFGTAFTDLPQSRTEAENGGLVLASSVIEPLAVNTPALTAGNVPAGGYPPPSFSGWLVLQDGALERYTRYLGAAPLWLSGTITFASVGTPLLALTAIAPDAALDLGLVQLRQVGVQLSTDYPDPYAELGTTVPTSAVLLYGVLGTGPVTATLTAPLLAGDSVWPLTVGFGNPGLTVSDLGGLLRSLLPGSGAGDFTLPAGVPGLDAFALSEIELGVTPPTDQEAIGLSYTAVNIRSTLPWDVPIPYVLIQQVGVRFLFFWDNDPLIPLAALSGTLVIGSKTGGSTGGTRTARLGGATPAPPVPAGQDGQGIRIWINVTLPDLSVSAATQDEIDIDLVEIFPAYFGGTPPTVGANLKITEINVFASVFNKAYNADMTVLGRWPVTAGNVTFNLDEIVFAVAVSQSTVSGSLAGTASITLWGQSGEDAQTVQLLASATYPGDGSWVFEAGLAEGPLPLVSFVSAFLGAEPPDWVKTQQFEINLTEFYARYSTAERNPYLVRAALEAVLQDTVVGVPMSLAAAAEIERREATGGAGDNRAAASDGGMVTVGSVGGTFTVNRFQVGAAVSFGESEKTYTFGVTWDGVTLSAATSWTGTGAARHQVLTLRLSGLTLGGIVRYFVNLANPNANYRLDPPWDFLDTITLDRFALVIDPTLQTIALTYAVDLTLPFLSLQSVGILYDRSTGNPSVRLVVQGNFLGDDRTGANALRWDPVTQAPPAIPGQGQRLFSLRYLGMGQHVAPRGLLQYDSIADVLDTMRNTMVPVNGRPPTTGTDLQFDESSQWLFGLDCTVMDTVTLKLVLHDPDLYGILVSLAGPEAGSLAGLSFELLYKKVTADIGVFHARLQIPDAFRQLQFGAVSVTLGVITVDIYTNGNFRVDLGFPHNRDFSRSFAVEAGIFNGQGGLYFGLLDGATSTRVPAITNGTFSPVIELGVGLMVGVGRTFEKGPLSAGLYVDLLAVFEGTLAWFHPTDAGQPTAMYYWCRGTAGITGKLYGSVDFKIISVSISVEAYATATLTLAAYQSTLVELDVGVRVHASVKILFVTISFSFSLTLSASFTIGSTSAAPWTLAADQSGRTQAQLTASAHAPARRRPVHVAAQTRDAYLQARFAAGAAPQSAPVRAAGDGAAPDGWHLSFDRDARVFPGGGTRTATLRLVPAFTIADVPVNWSGEGDPPPNAHPEYRIAFVLAADSAVDPDAATLADTHQPTVAKSAAAETPPDTTFNQVAEAMLRWSLNAAGVTSPTGTVTLGQLQELVDQLALPEAESQGFTWANLDGFLGGNLHFLLGGIPSGDEDPASIGGVPFPMVPSLQWDSDDLPPPYDAMKFWQYQPVDGVYEAGVLRYFAPLDPRAPADQPGPSGDDGTETMATFVFREYFLLAARAAAQAAVDLLSAFPHAVAATDSLQGIANLFPTTMVQYTVVPDDSVDHVAYVLGMSSAELLALNPGFAQTLADASPGDAVAVTLGVTPESIASANPNRGVVQGVTVTLGDLAVPIQSGDTFSTLAARYGIAADGWLQTAALLQATGILRGGSSFEVPAWDYENPNDLPVETVAAVFYLRLPLAPDTPVPLSDWYAEAIVSLNGDAVSETGPLPNPLTVPSAYDDLATTAQWVPLPGDTLRSVAETLALAQNTPADDSVFANWLAAVQSANPAWMQGAVTLPDATAVVAAGDTLETLATRLLQDDTTASFGAIVEAADILQPLAYVTVPGASQAAPAGQTLVTLAQYYGLALEDLAGRAAEVEGLLAVDADQPLTVPAVPALGLTALTAAMHAGQPAATVSGQVARVMMHGLRLPAPVAVVEDGETVYEATGPMTGLYALTGQQVPGPAPLTGDDPATVRLTLTVSVGEATSWLAFADSTTVSQGTSLAALESVHPSLHDLNPALRARAAESHATLLAAAGTADAATTASAAPLPAGMIVMTEVVDSLTLELTEGDLQDGYPATGLVPAFDGEIRALPLGRPVPVRYPVNHPIRWQTTVAPLLPAAGGTTGAAVPTLWLLPAALMGMASSGESADAYRLVQVTPQAGPATDPAELNAYAWGMLIDLAIHQVPGSEGTVELFGADTADRQRLALLLDYLGVFPGSSAGDFPPPPTGESVSLTLTWQLPASAGAPAGLTSTALSQANSFVVKTNLSTETHSGGEQLDTRMLAEEEEPTPPPTPAPFASMTAADAPRFLALLWECSVVGGGGYWLHYQAPDGGTGIPATIFDQDGRATLSLLVQLASQSGTAQTGWPVRNLFAFNNVAVVGDGIDPGSVALFAQSTDPGDTTPQATVQQGKVGFTLDLAAPPASSDPTPQQSLQALYSLVGYQLLETAAFNGSDEGQPLGPEVHPGEDGTVDESTWTLMRVIPITNFARTPAVPAVPGFPAPAADPYAGIAGASALSTSTWVQASTTVQLWFHDILGNVTAPQADSDGSGGSGDGTGLVSQVTVPVGYTDPVIPAGAWPATTLSYAVTAPQTSGGGAPATAVLAVTASLQAVVYQPGGAEAGPAGAARAARDRDRFACVYYQVMQPDVTAYLLTSLQQAPPVDGAESEPDLLSTPTTPLQGYAAGSYALLASLAGLGAYTPGGTPALDTVSTTYGVDYDAIGAANAGTALGSVVSTTTLQVPQLAVFRTSDTVLGLCGGDATLAQGVMTDADNVVLPLHPGTELASPATTKGVPATPPSATELAAGFGVSLETLVAQNAATAALLTPGFVFDCNGYTVTVPDSGDDADETLDDVAAAFAAQGLPYDAVTVVQMNADRPGLFRAGASLSVAGWIVQPEETLAKNGSGATAAQLAPLNTGTAGLFPDGTPLYIQSTSQALSPTATLGDTAAALGISPGNLLRHNGTVTVGTAFAVPGLYGWPDDATTLRVPYTIRSGDTLQGIAGRFPFTGTGAAPAQALVGMNADVPGTLAGGQTFTVGGETATTQAGDSFRSYADRFTPTAVELDDLASVIYQSAAVLQAGALLLAPPATLPPATSPATALTPVQAAAPFGVSPTALLGANAGTPGLLAEGVALRASTVDTSTETTAASDSVTAVLRRFQLRAITTSVDALATANADIAFITPGAAALLPPADAVLPATLGGFDPEEDDAPLDAPWKFPAGIFPIHVWVQLGRQFALVNADLAGTEEDPAAAVRARSAVPAARQGLPQDQADGGAVTLTGFAAALEAAIPPVRVATGKVLSEEDESAATDVWAVVFSDARIESVTVTPPVTLPGVSGAQPRTFALRPLVNALVARSGVELQTLDTSTGTLTGSETLSFQGVDLEVWARAFLADVDLVLGVLYAPGAYVVNRAALQSIVTAKQTLALAVAGGLGYVLQAESGAPAAKRDAARETLRQQLLLSLSRGYRASAVLQYDTTAQTPWDTEYARFSGASDITFGSQDPQLKLASVSNARVSLQNGGSEVDLVVWVPDVEEHETLPITLDFRLVEMEFNVATEIEGYDRSDWLTFVNPVETGEPLQVQVNLGAPTVPLPLRAYPPMPTLLDHHADTPATADSVDDAVHWTYRFRLQHQSAEQDEIRLEVEMNRGPALPMFLALQDDDLFGWLAQYTYVSSPLLGILGALQDWSKIADTAVVSAALDTFATLAGKVGGAWASHWGVALPTTSTWTTGDPAALPADDDTAAGLSASPSAASSSAAEGSGAAGGSGGSGDDPSDPAPTELYAFTMTLEADETSTYYQSLALQRTETGGDMGWPSITCYVTGGEPVVLQPGTGCECADGDDDCQCYLFPAGSNVPAFALLTCELAFGPLHVADYQSAIATVWVTRNAALFGEGGPATTPDFVYQTPQSSYAEPVVPFISIADRIEIGTWSYDPATSPLTPLFATLFDDEPEGRNIAIGVRYGYQLAAGDPPLESYLPARQSAVVEYGDDTVSDTCTSLQGWFDSASPAVVGGRWAFWVDLYSTVDPSLRRPVLQLKRLISPLD